MANRKIIPTFGCATLHPDQHCVPMDNGREARWRRETGCGGAVDHTPWDSGLRSQR